MRILAAMLIPVAAFAQLPASATLSDTDRVQLSAEIERLETLLAHAPDEAAVTYFIAAAWVSAKQWPEAMEWIRKVAGMKAGFDPSRQPLFADLRGTKEFAELMDSVRAATPPVSHSRLAFRVTEGDLAPESVAYDPAAKQLYFGSMRKGKVIRCSSSGGCRNFVTGLGTVLGMKIRGDGLWLLDNSHQESALVHYGLKSGAMVRKYAIAEKGHAFNDLVFAPSGDVYFTDTRRGAVWRLRNEKLERVRGEFQFANGIAISSDGRLLYVSAFPDGISVVDLKTGEVGPIGRPSELCLAAIDGLYFRGAELIAIQNGPMSPRVVRFALSPDLRTIRRFEVLERRNPLFDGVTTGVVIGDEFYFMANIQDEQKDRYDPIVMLRMRLQRQTAY
jgi:sugar lactone lactonase YvrE